MATQTLLQIVQNILSRMSSDEVNSISDTTESLQVANIVQTKYYDIVARGSLTIDEQLFQLTPSGDPTKPTQMTMPQGITRLDWLQYFDSNPLNSVQDDQFGAFSHDLNLDLVATVNWTTTSTTSNTISSTASVTFTVASATLPIKIGQTATAVSGSASMFGKVLSYVGTTLVMLMSSSTGSGTFNSWVITSVSVPNAPPGYKYVNIVPIDYFLSVTNRFDITQTNAFTYTFNEGGGNMFTFRYRNDRQPTMCTVISNNWVLFDSFDATQDSTLQDSKVLAYGQFIPQFQLNDNFIPQLDDLQFPLLLNEATSLAFYELKQMPHAKADEEIKRQWAVAQKTKSIANKPSYYDQLANFGRVPRTGGYGGSPIYRWMRNGL